MPIFQVQGVRGCL